MRSTRDLHAHLSDGAGKGVSGRRAAHRSIKPKPRYVEVCDQLQLSIITGKYPVSTFLPSEIELCREFGVSRHTVREAVRRLELRGLVSRKQGRGTRVDADHRVSRTARLLGSIEEVERHGRDTQLVSIRARTVVADAELAALLPCEVGDSFLWIESHREPRETTARWPRAWNETFIPERFAGIQGEIEAWPGAIYTLVERRFGERVTTIRQEVAALNLAPAVARCLKVKPGTAGLRIKRTYFGMLGDVLLYGFNTYVGDQFELAMDIKAHD